MTFKIYTDCLRVDSFKFISRIFCTLTCAKEKDPSPSVALAGQETSERRQKKNLKFLALSVTAFKIFNLYHCP
jgi:hypothetical protein